MNQKELRNNLLMCASISFAIACFYYFPFAHIGLEYFHNDDKLLIEKLSKIGGLSDAFGFVFNVDHLKFRPLANFQYLIEYFIFSEFYSLYVLYNLILIIILNSLFLLILNKEKSLSLFANIFISVCLISSKFLVYSAWNITGSFETLSTIFFAFLLYSMFYNRGKNLVFIGILLLLTSERFLPFVIVVPILYFYVSSDQSLIRVAIKKAYQPIIICLLYVAGRAALGLPIIVGTQTDSVATSFKIDTFLEHFYQSCGELLGFSFGPTYLTGFQFADWVPFSALMANTPYITVFFAMLVLVIFSFFSYFFSSFSENRKAVVLNLAMLSMICAASVTFRLELRWLLPTYLCFLLLIFMNLLSSQSESNSQVKRFKGFLCFCFVLSTIVASFLYSATGRESLYFAKQLHDVSAVNIYVKPFLRFLTVRK